MQTLKLTYKQSVFPANFLSEIKLVYTWSKLRKKKSM